MKELISIIIPVHNTEKYLIRCIDSVLMQTYQNIEIILIDDGSSDGSSEICDKYMNENPKVKVIHQKNKGVSHARNAGINIISGEYFLCVDSDDWLEPSMLEILYRNIKRYNADISACNFYVNYESGKEIVKSNINKNILILTNIQEMYEKLFATNEYGGYLWNKLLKTSIVKNKIYFDERIAIEEDVMFLINVLKKCNKICYDSNSILYHYFQRNMSAVRFNYTVKDITKLYVLEEKLKIKKQYNLQSLDDLEYEYVFLLEQTRCIMKKEKLNNKELENKIKTQILKYYKVAIKKVKFTKKVKLLLITISPIIYGNIMITKKKFIDRRKR